MAVTLAEVFGTRDVVEDCKQSVQSKPLFSSFAPRLFGEVILRDGTRRMYRTRATKKKAAEQEILVFVASLEQAIGDTVMWRIKGEKEYRLSTQQTVSKSRGTNLKQAILSFFDLED